MKDDNHEPGELMTGKEAARRLGVSPKTISRLVKEGKLQRVVLRGIKRFRRTDLDAFVAGLKKEEIS